MWELKTYFGVNAVGFPPSHKLVRKLQPRGVKCHIHGHGHLIADVTDSGSDIFMEDSPTML